MEQCNLYANPRATRTSCGESMELSRGGFESAYAEIVSWPGYETTPLICLPGLARANGIANIWYKDEGSRFGLGSFKALGGAYAVFRLLQRTVAARTALTPSSAQLRSGEFRTLTETVTVSTATDGNHGRSVAWGAHLFHCPSVVYVPHTCSRNREAAISAYGARVVRCRGGYDSTIEQAIYDASLHGWSVVSDTSWDGYEEIPAVAMQGYTVMTREILDQLRLGPPPTGSGGECALLRGLGRPETAIRRS
jgi:diaminopropionate ammonia-lyase